jgi:hypothetical protein
MGLVVIAAACKQASRAHFGQVVAFVPAGKPLAKLAPSWSVFDRRSVTTRPTSPI